MNETARTIGPLEDIDEWEEVIRARYADEPGALREYNLSKGRAEFRDYEANARPSVREFYRLNHANQTLEFVRTKKAEYLPKQKGQMGIWEAMEFLNTLVDDSDPDVDFTQIEHLMQTAEAIRKDGRPDWFVLTGLIHDLGKVLCLYGEPQWAVVGDTFPVGCAFSETIVFHPYFADNPDSQNPRYQSRLGIYEEGCGLDKVHLSWVHDEYLYHVVKDGLPDEALYMIRYHSFYPAHREGAYAYLMNEKDRKMFDWVRAFNPYDLYTKSHDRPDVKKIRPFYEELIAEFFPAKL